MSEVSKYFNIVKNFIVDPATRFYYLTKLGLTHYMSDENFIKKAFYLKMGYEVNFDAPKTFNEKLQWLKLYDRKPIYTTMVDKYAVKDYVASIIGEEYIIPTLGVWESFDDIDFHSLPKQFVLKCTHDSGGLVIVKDKSKFDVKSARKKINRCLKRNYYWLGREWPYKNVKPRIIAEEYIEDTETNELRDYKFFMFSGEAKALFIASDRMKNEDTKFDFFDMDFNSLQIVNGHPNSIVSPSKPENFNEMKELAEKLSKDIPHLRVDFYNANNKVYFGELTFSHWSGLVPFKPEKWDLIFGDWIKLPATDNNEQGGGG